MKKILLSLFLPLVCLAQPNQGGGPFPIGGVNPTGSGVALTNLNTSALSTIALTNQVTDTAWQRSAALTPLLWFGTYYSTYGTSNSPTASSISTQFYQNTYCVTNAVNYFTTSSIPIDFYSLDQGDPGQIGNRNFTNANQGMSWTSQTGRDSNGNITWNTNAFPEGMPWLAAYIHTNGNSKLSLWLGRLNGGTITSPYKGGRDVTTCLGWGVDGFTFDHTSDHTFTHQGVNIESDYNAYQSYDRQYFSDVFYALQRTTFTTNRNADTIPLTSQRTNAVMIHIYGSGYWDFCLNMANQYLLDLGGNSFMPVTGTANPIDIENNLELFVDQHTNQVSWVSPGHTIICGSFNMDCDKGSVTNLINALTMEAYSVSINYQGHGYDSINTPMHNALTNSEVRAIWKDPLVKMALPVTNWVVGVTNVGVWVKQLTDGFSVTYWNRDTNHSILMSCPFTLMDKSLVGSITVRDPWGQTNVTTTAATNFSFTIPPARLLTWKMTKDPQPTLVSDLVVSWPLTEGKGTVALDVSGNLYNGVQNRTNVWDGSGRWRGNGTDTVKRADVGQVAGSLTNNGMAASIWYNATNADAYQMLFSNGGSSAGSWALSFQDTSTFYFYIYTTNVPSATTVATTNIADGLWHNALIQYDGAFQYLFIDGSQFSKVARTGVPTATYSDLNVGGRDEVLAYNYGNLADFRLWSRPLSASEIKLLYATGRRQ